MTAETYLFFATPMALLGLAFAAYVVVDAFGRNAQRKPAPIRIRKDGRRR